MQNVLIYGANGYTGTLIAREAVRRGHSPMLAGRNEKAVAELAGELGLRQRGFALDRPEQVDAGLEGMQVVVNCAGPFTRTAGPMTEACLRKKVHYLDITGEVPVFEALIARDLAAQAAGVMLLPGAGFDVVPSDCLAAHLKRRLPSATHLAVGVSTLMQLSRGTAKTMTENVGLGGFVRRDGQLTKVPSGWKTRVIDFGKGPEKAITIPWGDVSTAWFSTRIPNFEFYAAAPLLPRVVTRLTRYLGWALNRPAVQRLIKRRIDSGPAGPTDAQRARGKSYLWGEASDAAGQRVVSRMVTPEGYSLTVETVLLIVHRILSGNVRGGFQTPSSAYGPDLILEIANVTRTDEIR